MVPVAIALLGERYRPLTVAFSGWFGPRPKRTAGPFAARYGRRMAALPPGAPEPEGATEPRPSRTSWAGTDRT